MRIVVLDDYQDAVRSLACFSKVSGHEVVIHRDTVTGEALVERLQGAEAVVLIRERTRLAADVLERLKSLKFVSQTGRPGGNLDVAACTRLGIAVGFTSGSARSTAELTFGLMLSAMRHIPLEDRRLREGSWQTTLGRALHGLVLGIYAPGNIGSLVAGYGRAFGMTVLVHGRDAARERAAKDGYEFVSRERLFSECDVVSLHIRLLPETRGIVKGSDLALMKPDALIVNTSRAELVEHGALEAALKAGRPGFAAVDVYESEPILGAKHPLLAMDNVVATPHLGYVERSNYETFFGTAFDNILAFAAGKPQNLVNPEVVKG